MSHCAMSQQVGTDFSDQPTGRPRRKVLKRLPHHGKYLILLEKASWRSGDAADCKSVYTGSIPVLASTRTHDIENQGKILTLSKHALSDPYNNSGSKDEGMYRLKQPRGPGTSWVLRMDTPAALIGITNPWTGKPFRKTIGKGLGTPYLSEARRLRDIYVGQLRQMEYDASDASKYDADMALAFRQELQEADAKDPTGKTAEGLELAMSNALEAAESRGQPRKKLRQFNRIASRSGYPFANPTSYPLQPVRVFMFDKKQWIEDHVQIYHMTHCPPHFSLMEPLALGNDRALPQQSIAAITNIDDIEIYIQHRERELGKKYLKVFDLAVEDRSEVLQQLGLMGISPGSLFPGIEGVCQEYRDRHFGYGD